MEETLIDEQQLERPKRPVFLTVLCFLTWIGSAILAFVLGFMYFEFGKNQARFGYNWYVELVRNYFLICICASLLSAASAVLMWQLRRIGFYTYLAGQLIPVVLLIGTLVYSGIDPGKMETEMIAIVSAWSILPLVFCVVYASQLKHLQKRTKRKS